LKRLTTVILAVLLLAGLGVAIFLSTPPTAKSNVPALFLEFARADVKTLDIRNGEGEVHLERDGTDRERWRVLIGKTPVRASSLKVEDLLNDLSRLAPKNFWAKADVRPEERKGWGIDAAPVQVTLGLEGRTIKASFGARTLEKQNVYAEKDGNGDAYVVPVAAVEPLERARADLLRERSPAGFSSYEARSLSLRRADGLAVDAEKGAGGTWEVTAPFRGPADPAAIDGLLAKSLGVEVVDFVADGAVDLARYGLLEPRAVLTVHRQGREKPVVLKLGGDAGADKVHFMEEGEASVYTCGPDFPNAVAKFDPAALRDRNLLRIGWAKIDSIEFTHPEKGWKLLRVLDRWDVEKPERVPAEATLADGLLDEIRKAEVARFLDGEDPATLGLGKAEDAAAVLSLVGVDEAGTRRLLIGKRDAGGKVPARLLPPPGTKGDPPPVLLEPALLDRLEKGWLSFRTREVLKFDLADVKALSRRTAAGEETFLREGTAWKASPGGPEPDADALGAALARLLHLDALAFEARTKEGLEAYGLGEPPAGPAISVTLQKGSEEKRTRTLVLGGPAEENVSHYARMADGDLVFRLEDRTVSGTTIVNLHELLTAPWTKGK
jgi:hypothetical protein